MESKRKRKKTQFPIYMAVSFLTVFILLTVLNLFHRDRTFSDNENRMLAMKPKASLEKILDGKYASDYETYVNDQFVFRDMWIRLRGFTDVLVGKNKSNGVYRGKSGYLIEDFTVPDTQNYQETMNALKAFSERHPDVQKYMLLAPNAVNILEDKLPFQAPVADQNLWIDKVFKETEEAGFQKIDVRESLKKHSKEDIYYRTDHHWTTKGAYYAYREAADILGITDTVRCELMTVSNQFQGTLSAKSGYRMSEKEDLQVYYPEEGLKPSVVTYVDEQKKTSSLYNSDKLKERDKYGMFLNGNHALLKIETPSEANKSIMILKDSYANCLIPFLTDYYRKIIVVDPRYYYENLDELMAVEDITEVMILMNANSFFQDTTLKSVLNPAA